MPEYTIDVSSLRNSRILEVIRLLGLNKTKRFYQASTSGFYGLAQEVSQTEKPPFYPRSPYSVVNSKVFLIVTNYREAYGPFACNGILFNHESPRRRATSVTRKIPEGLAGFSRGLSSELRLGNLSALWDWGRAKDDVKMQWLVLLQTEPKDFVFASGR
jgi:GDPmannose 4,6-dehydratase